METRHTLYGYELIKKGLAGSRAHPVARALIELHMQLCQCDGTNIKIARVALLERPLGDVMVELAKIEELRQL